MMVAIYKFMVSYNTLVVLSVTMLDTGCLILDEMRNKKHEY